MKGTCSRRAITAGAVGCAVSLALGVLAHPSRAVDEPAPASLHVPAPPLSGGGPWLNCAPLTIRGLRGHVVALHFWTLGCINCKHNLPYYQGWQRDFAGRGLVIVGVHTPETPYEASVEHVKEAVRDRSIAYPVVVDGKSNIWRAWRNNVWPAVYLIDKKGVVRWYWEGELGWQGIHGDAAMRAKIEQLLAEKA